MKKVLISHWLSDDLVERFKDELILDCPPMDKAYYTEDELKERLSSDHAALLVAETAVDKTMIDKGKSLEVIASFGAGYNNIDDCYAAEKGIYVVNAPNSVTDATAELTWR